METYFIIEIKAYNDGTATIPIPEVFQISNQVEENAMISSYFDACSNAAKSTCDTHTVEVVDSEGSVWKGYKQVFHHGHEVEE